MIASEYNQKNQKINNDALDNTLKYRMIYID